MTSRDTQTWEAEVDRRLALLQPHRPEAADSSSRDDTLQDGDGLLISAPPSAESTEPNREISVSQLHVEVFHSVRAGMALDEDIYDESDMLLLAAGSIITTRFLQLLRDRGISRVHLRKPASTTPKRKEPGKTPRAVPVRRSPDGDELHTPHSTELDERMPELLSCPLEFRSVPTWRRPRMTIDDLKAETERTIQSHKQTSMAVANLCDTLGSGRRISSEDVQAAVSRFVDKAAVDFDLLPLVVSLQESGDEYLFDHCVSVALVSAAIACQLGLDRSTILETSLGGLLQDIGMLRVPSEIRMAARPLTAEEWQEVHLHPLHTLDMLADLKGLPLSAKFIAYQSHERINGEGYPRGRRGDQIHRAAQIVSIADTFVALTSERPYRHALSHYESAKTILLSGQSGWFDRNLIRAFLDTVSLFPIGSRVELNDGRAARVLRANPGRHTNPVVEEITDDGYLTGHIIDLAKEPHLGVVNAF